MLLFQRYQGSFEKKFEALLKMNLKNGNITVLCVIKNAVFLSFNKPIKFIVIFSVENVDVMTVAILRADIFSDFKIQ